VSKVLLLSGGLDSTSIASWLKPERCLGINYGQKSAAAELRAGAAIAGDLGLAFEHVTVDASAIGGGLMSGSQGFSDGSPEWWPYRNQLLVTVAAAWAVTRGHDEVLVGTVAGDGDRHADGRPHFYDLMNELLRFQEGHLSVSAPAIGLTATELIDVSGVSDRALGWTHSCHVSNIPCNRCPGCVKRTQVLTAAGRLQ
jgi:7-cyano-7-deazaguanine synthase